jgi:hypothetical protein
MENKQTAVEWLIQELINCDKLLDGRRKNEDATVFKTNPTKIYEQAKQMHKEQIIDAFKKGELPEWFENLDAEQYYNETYGKN